MMPRISSDRDENGLFRVSRWLGLGGLNEWPARFGDDRGLGC